MAAATYPLKIEQGVPFVRSVRVSSGSEPFPLTGYSAKAQVRRDPVDVSGGDPGDPLVEFTCAVDDVLDEITFALTATQASSLPVTTQGYTWEWDLVITKSETEGYRLLQGPVTVSPAVTVSAPVTP